MTKEAFYSFFKKIPKTELHLHLEAVISKGTIRRFYLRRHPELTSEQADEEIQKNLFSYFDLDGFIKSFIAIQNLYDSPADFDYVFADLRDYLVRNSIVYAEVFVAPSAFIKKGFAFSELVEIFHRNIEKIKKETGITVRLLVDVSRTFGSENAAQNLQLVLENRSPDIIGIGLGGSEIKGPAKLFGNVFKKARENGLVAVAHAGEDVGPESVWDSIDILHASRIGHGISAVQDETLMQTLAERKIPLEICLTSNAFTKRYIKKIASHPVHTFFDKGIVVTLNSDDPLFFGSELLNEYWNAYKQLKFTLKELKQIVQNSFTASFMTESEKKKFLSDVDSAWKKREAESETTHMAMSTMPVLKRTVLAIGVPTAAIFLLITLIVSNHIARSTRRLVFDGMSAQTEVCVQMLEKTLAAPMKMTEALAAFFENGFPADDRANRDVFVKMSHIYPDLPGFYCGLTTKKTYSSPNIVLPDTYDPTSRDWYKGAAALGGKMYYSDVYPDSQTNELVVTLSQAVYKDGKLDGVVAFDYTLTDLVTIVRSLKVDTLDKSFILSADEKFFMHEDFTPDDNILNLPGDYGRIGKKLLESKNGFVKEKLDGTKYIFKVTAVPMTGWLYVFAKPERTVNANSATAVRILTVSFLFLFAVIMGITIVILRRMRAKEVQLSGRLMEEVQYLSVSAKENAATSQEQSAAVKEIVATMEDNTKLSEHISQKIKDVSAVAGKTRGNVSEGIALLSENVQQMREIAEANAQTIEGIKLLGGKIENIWDIVSLINSVADQAKIIAFNAELEASSAGEAGKNFHIVASEIRRLADGIIDGTKEIKQQISEIQESSDRLILASESDTEKIQAGVTGAQTLSARFDSIQMASDITADSAGDITTIIQQQAQASEQILITLKQIAFGVENFSQATEQISASVAKLGTIAGELNK